MAADDSGGKQIGRTAWDIAHTIIQSRAALTIVAATAVIALCLVLSGYLRITYSKDGWSACLPCDREGADKKELPEKPFASILKIPLHSPIDEVRASMPELDFSKDGLFSYNQDFLGYPMQIYETIDRKGYTNGFSFEYFVRHEKLKDQPMVEKLSGSTARDVSDHCYGGKYTDFVKRLSEHFGAGRFIERTEDREAPAASTSYSQGLMDSYCAKLETQMWGACHTVVLREKRRLEFKKEKLGRLTFVAVETSSTTRSRKNGESEIDSEFNSDRDVHSEATCTWTGHFVSEAESK